MAGSNNIGDSLRTLLEIICSEPGCKMRVQELQRQIQRERIRLPQDLSLLIQQYEQYFLLTGSTVTAITSLELCPEHWKETGNCDATSCDKLHICKFYLLDKCRFEKMKVKCNFGHDLHSRHNSRILSEHLLDSLSPAQIRELLKSDANRSASTMPVICRYYNKINGCSKNGTCPHLHICEFYVMGGCRFGRRCRRNHDINTSLKQRLRQYGIDTTRRCGDILNDLRQSISTSRPPPANTYSGMRRYSSMPVITLNSGRVGRSQGGRRHQLSEGPGDAGDLGVSGRGEICMYNLRGGKGCWFHDSCHADHKPRPFQWQYLVAQTWQDFDSDTNEKIEEGFCNVDCSESIINMEEYQESITSEESYDSSEEVAVIKTNGIHRDEGEATVTVDFMQMVALSANRQFQVRRLSTPSQGALKPQIASSFARQVTVWLWFWFDEDQQEWIEYGQQGSGGFRANVTSAEIEEAFTKRSGHIEFKVAMQWHKLRFSRMSQKNKQTGSKKDVRRRPQPRN